MYSFFFFFFKKLKYAYKNYLFKKKKILASSFKYSAANKTRERSLSHVLMRVSLCVFLYVNYVFKLTYPTFLHSKSLSLINTFFSLKQFD